MVKQRIISIVAILLICLILSSCVGPPVGHTYVDNVDRYLELNSYVTDMLQKKFYGSLPETITNKDEVIDYYFDYSCAVFGDPSFLIELKMRYEDAWLKKDEKQRLDNLLRSEPVYIDQKIYYIFQGDLNSFSMYLDDQIYDGLCIFFELVIIDPEQMTIKYISAMQQDNKDKIDELSSQAKAIIGYYMLSEDQ